MTIHPSVFMLTFRVIDLAQATIPTALVTTPLRPDIVVYNSTTPTVALLELMCPLNLEHNIQCTRSNIYSYLQSLIVCRLLITMKQLRLVCWVTTSHPLFKTLRISLISYNLLLHPNLPSD